MSDTKKEIFIGARNLGKEGVKKILPTYDLLLDQIKGFRNAAINNNSKNEKMDFNNTISIWGPRGAGKTSVLYTIHNDLIQEGGNSEYKAVNKNIILNIVDPDNFSDLTKIIGVILGSFRELVIENIERNIKNLSYKYCTNDRFKDYFNNGRYIENSNPLRRKLDELLEVYCYIDTEYRKLLTQNFTNLERYKKEYANVLSPDIKFGEIFIEFVDKLVEVNNEINELDNEDTTMIFITIDDADLKQEKCKEIIETIMKYICHKNIVCLISGDYEIFSDSVTLSLIGNELLKSKYTDDEKFLNSEVSISKRKNNLTGEYLKKIIPPSFRHNLIKWDLESISKFSFEINKHSDSKEINAENELNITNKLSELLGEENNIFRYKLNNGEIIVPRISYCIFDNTPRGLINVLYSLSKIKNKKFEEIKSFIDTIVESSSFLNKYKTKFFNKYLIWGDSFDNTRIDYSKLENDMSTIEKNINENGGGKDIRKKRKKFLIFFIILELVKKLSEEIKFDKKDYKELKERMLYLIINNQEKNEIVIDQNGETYSKEDFRVSLKYLNCLILESDLEIAFVLIEKLREIKDFSLSKLSDEEMKKSIYVVMNDFIGIDEKSSVNSSDFLINIIIKSKESSKESQEYDKFIDFMNEMSLKNNFHEHLKNLLQERENDFNKSLEIFYKAPIYNLLKKIKNKKDFNYENIKNVKKNFPKAEKYKIALEKIKNKKNFEDKEIKKLKRTIEKLKNNSEIKVDQLINFNIHIYKKYAEVNIENLRNDFNKFIESENNGVNSNFKKIQNEFKENPVLNDRNNDYIQCIDYIKILQRLKKEITTKVWYGYKERFELEKAIVDKIILSEKTLIYLYILYIKNKDERVEDIDYIDYITYIIKLEMEFMERFNDDILKEKRLDKIRENYINVFNNSYKEAMDIENTSLQELGLDIDDIEVQLDY